MKTLETLQQALTDIQGHTVGLYFNPHTKSYEPVVEMTETSFCTITVSPLLGLHTVFYPRDAQHIVIQFPNTLPVAKTFIRGVPQYEYNKESGTLAGAMKTPQAFYSWYKLYCTDI